MNPVPSLGDYIQMQKDIEKRLPGIKAAEAAGAAPVSGQSVFDAMKEAGIPEPIEQTANIGAGAEALKMPEFGSQFSDGVKPDVSGDGIEVGGDVGGSAIMAGASALKGILKAKAEKEALEFQKKREMTESQSKAQQKTAARGMGAGVQNMQQLIANFRSAAR